MPRRRKFFAWPWRSRTQIASDVDAELRFHLESRAAELVAGGATPAAARAQAEREFGDVEFTRRYCSEQDAGTERSARFADRLADLRQDVRYAWRALRTNPGYAAVSLATLAIAIGANVAMFSVTSAVLLEPLPYRDPSQLVAVMDHPRDTPANRYELSPADYLDYRAQQHAFTDIAAVTPYGGSLTLLDAEGGPEAVPMLLTTANTFELLGARAARGRALLADDDRPDRARVVVLSWGLWQRRFHGDTMVIGRTIPFADAPRTIVGVMPQGFTLGYREDVWVPLNLTPLLANPDRARKFHFLYGVARLKPGRSADDGARDLDAIARDLERLHPDANTGHGALPIPLRDSMVGSSRSAILILNGAALLVLLIACANLANVALARGIARRREIAVRIALGASRGRIVRQLLTESLLVGGAGGAIGVACASIGTRVLLAMAPGMLPSIRDVRLSPWVIGFAVLVTVGTALLAGLVPALDGARSDPHAALKASARAGGGREPLRRLLVVAQTALAVVLLTGAGLLVRSFQALERVQLGFAPDHVLTAMLSVGGTRYDSSSAVRAFFDGVAARLREAPGVVAVGGINNLPLQGGGSSSLVIEGRPFDPTRIPEVRYSALTEGALEALRVPVLQGRAFDATDRPDGPQSLIVNEAFAKMYFPAGDAVGHRVRLGPNPNAPWATIVGVIGDMRTGGIDAEPRPTAFENIAQQGFRTVAFVIRTRGAPSDAVPALRAAVRALDPNVAVRAVSTLDDVVSGSVAGRRFAMMLVSSFAVLALVLAAVGVYGVLAFAVSARTREFGVRMALGATGRNVLGLVVRQGLAQAAVGLTFGVGGALAAGRLIEKMLYGVHATDVTTFAGVTALLLVTMLAASLAPALRATRTDPLRSLREE